ncbi:MAG: endonuclease domain-containing protein [Defluviicoccus sp.]
MPWHEKPIGRARALRRRLTEAEQRLWARLRNRGFSGWKFRRQVPIGPFIADFACIEARLVIEVDGGQHASTEEADGERTKTLATFGYTVLRFWNNEVMTNIDGVLTAISVALAEVKDHPHPGPLPPAGEGADRALPSPRPQAGEGGARVSGRVRGISQPQARAGKART